MTGDADYWRGFIAGAGLPAPEAPTAERVLDALMVAAQRHILAGAERGGATLAKTMSGALRGVRASDPDLFAELACEELSIDIDRYLAWRREQEGDE